MGEINAYSKIYSILDTAHTMFCTVFSPTSWKVTGLIPIGVTGIFHWHNPSGQTMALGSTQPLTEMSTRNISWGVKAASV